MCDEETVLLLLFTAINEKKIIYCLQIEQAERNF